MTHQDDQKPTDDDETIARLHAEMDTWTVVAVWTTKGGRAYRTFAVGTHIELRAGELRSILEDQIAERDAAKAQGEMVRSFTLDGVPFAVDPDYVGAIEVQLLGPDGQLITDIRPGFIDRDGPVDRDDDEPDPGDGRQ